MPKARERIYTDIFAILGDKKFNMMRLCFTTDIEFGHTPCQVTTSPEEDDLICQGEDYAELERNPERGEENRAYGTDLVRRKYLVPQIAMSGGSMIACACKEILMGLNSTLARSTSQIGGMPAQAIRANLIEPRRKYGLIKQRDLSGNQF